MGAVPIDIPRTLLPERRMPAYTERGDGGFEPELIQKGQTRIDGMDDKIKALYAAGLSTRDIRAHLEAVYGLKGRAKPFVSGLDALILIQFLVDLVIDLSDFAATLLRLTD